MTEPAKRKPRVVKRTPYQKPGQPTGEGLVGGFDDENLVGRPITLGQYLRANPPREPEPAHIARRTNL